MALDELQQNDITFTEQRIIFVIIKKLFDDVKPIKINYIESVNGSGFQLKSSLSPCGGCCRRDI